MFLKGKYLNIANLTYHYNIWIGRYIGINTNARIARDMDLLQMVYAFFEYFCKNLDRCTAPQVKLRVNEIVSMKTDLGNRLFDRLINNNSDFDCIFEILNKGE